MTNSLSDWANIIKGTGEKQAIIRSESRKALEEFSSEIPLTEFAEKICEMGLRHQTAMMKLSGITYISGGIEEIPNWLEELKEVRNFLNSLKSE